MPVVLLAAQVRGARGRQPAAECPGVACRRGDGSARVAFVCCIASLRHALLTAVSPTPHPASMPCPRSPSATACMRGGCSARSASARAGWTRCGAAWSTTWPPSCLGRRGCWLGRRPGAGPRGAVPVLQPPLAGAQLWIHGRLQPLPVQGAAGGAACPPVRLLRLRLPGWLPAVDACTGHPGGRCAMGHASQAWHAVKSAPAAQAVRAGEPARPPAEPLASSPALQRSRPTCFPAARWTQWRRLRCWGAPACGRAMPGSARGRRASMRSRLAGLGRAVRASGPAQRTTTAPSRQRQVVVPCFAAVMPACWR